ncbi:MAG TPA: FAD-dependent oxidoreductase [Gemmatimonadaceae bacterium]|nr:FAD-dependent oxidoreductase [Gemmatimonadaceae bacterium]
MTARPAAGQRRPDVVVVGGGLVGLACAAALAADGALVNLLTASTQGEASAAAAGMLAPGVEHAGGAAHAFAVAGRGRYPSFLDAVADRTGLRVPLNTRGVLEVALADDEAHALAAARPPDAPWLDPAAVADAEPRLGATRGGVLHPRDGAVDNVALLAALARLAADHPGVTVSRGHARALRLGGGRVRVDGGSGPTIEAARVVLAAGAWVSRIAGLPRRLPVEPMRGQMIAYRDASLRHVIYGAGGYLVPRDDGRTLVGATMERVGFAVGTTPEGESQLTRTALALVPGLREAPRLAAWSGLRPMTPDLLPIIGTDPDAPELIYACGHSRNGVLLAPITGDAVAALAAGRTPPWDLTPFRVERFASVGGPTLD